MQLMHNQTIKLKISSKLDKELIKMPTTTMPAADSTMAAMMATVIMMAVIMMVAMAQAMAAATAAVPATVAATAAVPAILMVDTLVVKAALVLKIILAPISQQAIAGVNIATTSLVTTTIGDALKNSKHAKRDAAAMCLNTMKYKNANMYLNTIAKHAAAKFQNTMM